MTQPYGGAPLQLALDKLSAGQNVVFQVFGDSTSWGWFDWLEINTKHGWVGRFALKVAALYDANVTYNESAGFPSANTKTLRTSSIVGAPTIYVRNDSAIGWNLASHELNLSTRLPAPIPDIIFSSDGFNESDNAANFAAHYDRFITAVQALAPGAPIVVLTENFYAVQTLNKSPDPFPVLFNAIPKQFLSVSSLPLDPPLQVSNKYSGLWVLDTQQSFSDPAMTDGTVHPNGAGYEAQAKFMMTWLSPSAQPPVNVVKIAITTTSLATLTVGVAVSKQLTATGTDPITWSVQSGLPDGLALSSTGLLSGTPTVVGTYSITVRATGPGVGVQSDKTFSGVVNAPVVDPFIPNDASKLKIRLADRYYEVGLAVKINNAFRTVVCRD